MEGSNLFKEAIADAKAVRHTALLNAKVALEEAFSERYHEMFAKKLKEEAAMDDVAQTAPQPEEENVSEQEIDELIKELEAEVGGEQPPVPDGAGADAGAPPVPPVPDAGAVPPMGAGAPIMAGTPVILQPADAGAAMPPAPPVPPAGGDVPPASPPPSDVPPAQDQEEDENVDLNELLASLKEEVENEGCKEEEEEGIKEGCKEEEEEEEGKKLDEGTKLASSGIGGSKAGGSANKKPTSAASSTSKIETASNDDEGMPKVDQPKTVAKEATQAGRPNKATHATKDNLSTPSMGAGNGSGGQSETGMPKTDQAKTTAKEATQASRPNQGKNATATNLSTPGGMLEENASLKKQLQEATETITYVKGQLNEINLLNAKLLYTNKLFKEYNMNNEQKMRIVEMFDLSKSVREVKLTYANIAESLNFSGADIKRKSNSSVQSITEGLASKPVGSTKPDNKQIICESAMVSKFQKLAGIKRK